MPTQNESVSAIQSVAHAESFMAREYFDRMQQGGINQTVNMQKAVWAQRASAQYYRMARSHMGIEE